MATERQVHERELHGVPASLEEDPLLAIRRAIAALSEDDYRQLKVWLVEHDWDRWDEQIERDSERGALDFLADEVLEDERNGLLREL